MNGFKSSLQSSVFSLLSFTTIVNFTSHLIYNMTKSGRIRLIFVDDGNIVSCLILDFLIVSVFGSTAFETSFGNKTIAKYYNI